MPWRRFRALVLRWLGLQPEPRDLLVLQRRPGGARVMANPAEVVAAVRSNAGAGRPVWYRVERVSVVIAAAISAQRLTGFFAITGANCAAWAMFLPRRTAIVELFTESDRPAHVWNLAEVFGLAFFYSKGPWHFLWPMAARVPAIVVDAAARALGRYLREAFPVMDRPAVEPSAVLCEHRFLPLPANLGAECAL